MRPPPAAQPDSTQVTRPFERLIVGSNRNDILTRFLAANDMSVRGVEPSLSPSMDIQVSSNFERLLFELLDRDPALTRQTMLDFRQTGRMTVAWLKRFVDNDTRYEQFLCPGPSGSAVDEYRNTCPNVSP